MHFEGQAFKGSLQEYLLKGNFAFREYGLISTTAVWNKQ